MSDNIVELHPVNDGDSTFMACPCTPEGTPFMVVAIAGEHPIVTALVCPECQQEIPVENGVIG